MWWVAQAMLRSPPVLYFLLGMVLVYKWAGWFPIMVVRYGLKDALDAALINPGDASKRSARAGAGAHGGAHVGVSKATPP
jgi:hypothetical protein